MPPGNNDELSVVADELSQLEQVLSAAGVTQEEAQEADSQQVESQQPVAETVQPTKVSQPTTQVADKFADKQVDYVPPVKQENESDLAFDIRNIIKRNTALAKTALESDEIQLIKQENEALRRQYAAEMSRNKAQPPITNQNNFVQPTNLLDGYETYEEMIEDQQRVSEFARRSGFLTEDQLQQRFEEMQAEKLYLNTIENFVASKPALSNQEYRDAYVDFVSERFNVDGLTPKQFQAVLESAYTMLLGPEVSSRAAEARQAASPTRTIEKQQVVDPTSDDVMDPEIKAAFERMGITNP